MVDAVVTDIKGPTYLYQYTRLRALRSGTYHPSRAELGAYGKGIARRVALEETRKSRRLAYLADCPERSDERTPLDALLKAELLAKLGKVLTMLNEKELAVLRKRYGVAGGATKQPNALTAAERALLHRVLKKLKRLMGE